MQHRLIDPATDGTETDTPRRPGPLVQFLGGLAALALAWVLVLLLLKAGATLWRWLDPLAGW